MKQSSKNSSVGLTANQLKLIAIIAMFIDHIAVLFVSNQSLLGQIMHTIGRLTMPIMCYFIAEGYYKTRNLKKYLLRLLVFAGVSYYPFYLFATGVPPISFGENIIISPQIIMNTIFVLFIGLIALIVWESSKINKSLKIPIIITLCIFSTFGDWGYIAVLWVLMFGIYRGNFRRQSIGFGIISAVFILQSIFMTLNTEGAIWWQQSYQLGVLLALPLLATYNGSLGSIKSNKWVFYTFYPTHLLLLAYVKYYLI
ncbi:MAG: TraX family protein [Cellulosilyticaceae bacterium]